MELKRKNRMNDRLPATEFQQWSNLFLSIPSHSLNYSESNPHFMYLVYKYLAAFKVQGLVLTSQPQYNYHSKIIK